MWFRPSPGLGLGPKGQPTWFGVKKPELLVRRWLGLFTREDPEAPRGGACGHKPNGLTGTCVQQACPDGVQEETRLVFCLWLPFFVSQP